MPVGSEGEACGGRSVGGDEARRGRCGRCGGFLPGVCGGGRACAGGLCGGGGKKDLRMFLESAN